MPHSWRADTGRGSELCMWGIGIPSIEFMFYRQSSKVYERELMARLPNGTMVSIGPYKLSFRCTTNDFMFLRGGVRASRPTGILEG